MSLKYQATIACAKDCWPQLLPGRILRQGEWWLTFHCRWPWWLPWQRGRRQQVQYGRLPGAPWSCRPSLQTAPAPAPWSSEPQSPAPLSGRIPGCHSRQNSLKGQMDCSRRNSWYCSMQHSKRGYQILRLQAHLLGCIHCSITADLPSRPAHAGQR